MWGPAWRLISSCSVQYSIQTVYLKQLAKALFVCMLLGFYINSFTSDKEWEIKYCTWLHLVQYLISHLLWLVNLWMWITIAHSQGALTYIYCTVRRVYWENSVTTKITPNFFMSFYMSLTCTVQVTKCLKRYCAWKIFNFFYIVKLKPKPTQQPTPPQT